jgi:hypothetical protein
MREDRGGHSERVIITSCGPAGQSAWELACHTRSDHEFAGQRQFGPRPQLSIPFGHVAGTRATGEIPKVTVSILRGTTEGGNGKDHESHRDDKDYAVLQERSFPVDRG